MTAIAAAKHPKLIHFQVDGEHFETTNPNLTPNAIIADFAQLDPATHYLVQIEKGRQTSFKDKGSIAIEIENGDRFQVISLGPTTVSDGSPRSGVTVFSAGLRELGFEPKQLDGRPDHVFFDYVVASGTHAGKVVELGVIVPDTFPMNPPTGMHVSPHIHPINPQQEPHPRGGVHATHAEHFTVVLRRPWQYWSRPLTEWGTSKKTVAVYMNHVWKLWASQ